MDRGGFRLRSDQGLKLKAFRFAGWVAQPFFVSYFLFLVSVLRNSHLLLAFVLFLVCHVGRAEHEVLLQVHVS